ncbi:SBBP repeat-containing protein [Bacteroidota bacterium]
MKTRLQLKMITLIFVFFQLLSGSVKSQTFSWAQHIGGVNDDIGFGIATDPSGNVYITGGFESTVDFDPGPNTYSLSSNGLRDIFIAKYTSTGAFVWAVKIGGSSMEEGKSIALDNNGNLFITGKYTGTVDFDPGPGTNTITSSGNTDIFIAKFSQSGVYQWAYGIGGSSWDYGCSISVDTLGGVYITGYYMGTADFDPSSGTTSLTASFIDVFVAKFTSSGQLSFAFSIGGSGGDYGIKIKTDKSGNFYVTGNFSGTVDFDPSNSSAYRTAIGGNDVFVAKYTNSGNYVWAISFGGSGNDMGNSIDYDNSGNIYVTGDFYSTVDFDPGSGTVNLTSSGSGDIFIAKYNSQGNYIWAGKIGGVNSDVPRDISVDSNGNSYLTGEFFDVADFDPGTAVANLTASVAYSDIFVLKLNPNGNYLWAFQIGGSNSDIGYGITANDFGDIYATGYFRNTSDFNPGTVTNNLTSTGMSDMYILKLNDPSCIGFNATAIPSGSTTFCQGGSVVITANSGTGNTYQWYKNDTIINLATSSTYSATTSGHYKVVVTNINSCTDTSLAVPVIVHPLPNTNITTLGDSIFCLGDSIILKSDSNLTYQWKKDGNKIPGATNPIYTAFSTGSYYVVITDTNSCVDSSLSITLTANQIPIVNLGADTTLCLNIDTLTLNANGSFVQYLWSNGDTTQSISFTSAGSGIGTYPFWVEITDTIGCSAIDSILVTWVDCTGLNEVSNNSNINIFPNPANNQIIIENLRQKNDFVLSILNLNGQEVFKQHINESKTQIDISNLRSGLYFVKLINAKTLEIRKIIKE